MIMSGSTPRLVSIWGGLGSLALAALLLPVSPTWAQKAGDDNKQDTVLETVIVGQPETAGSGVFVGDTTLAIVVDRVDGEAVNGVEPTKLNVTVKTDDQPAVVVSGSLEQAISALKDQIKAIKEKSPLSDSDKRRAEALARAIEEINKVARQVKAIDLGATKDKTKLENRRIVIRKLDLDKMHVNAKPHTNQAHKPEAAKQLAEGKQNAEAAKQLADVNVRYRVLTKRLDAEQERAVKEKQAQVEKAAAEVAKARAKVDQLTKELMQKRQELSNANAELSQLKRVEARVVTIPDRMPAGPGGVFGSRSGSGSGSASRSAESRTIIGRKMSDPDDQRLAELEKKLNKLLEEVASLKKSRAN